MHSSTLSLTNADTLEIEIKKLLRSIIARNVEP